MFEDCLLYLCAFAGFPVVLLHTGEAVWPPKRVIPTTGRERVFSWDNLESAT